VKFEVNWPWSS